ncbi:pentatricopeptide repeat-containing protein At1g03540-like [Musa acuminata AAA Group]|uniref:pentatricopeptide repeat-containing protein At1g03540-like n=1 Tax=Musa acuminata AAA Group TaxID=214697 RepID=UPI0031D0E7C7
MKRLCKGYCSSAPPPSQSQIFLLRDSGENGRRHISKPLLYAARLQAATNSGSFSCGLRLHAHIIKSGLDSDRFVGNSLLSLYFMLCPDFSVTRHVFESLPVRDVISWTSMVSGYVRAGRPLESLLMFVKMSTFGGVEPNAFTLSSAVKASSDLGDVRLGRCFHGMVMTRGFETNHVIASALVYMYGRNSALEDARQMFDELPEPDAICWTSIISVLTWNDEFAKALSCFYSMMRRKELGIVPDGFTFGTIMTALGNLGRARQGKEAHAKVITSGLCGNVVVESSTLDMYAKCGYMVDSRKVFDRMASKNAVSWCALLGGYCQGKNYRAVLNLFRVMDKGDDHYSFGTVLRACAGLAAIREGKELHCKYLRMGGWRDVVVESALIDLYAKCGLIDYAYHLFTKIFIRNLITWNAMICGLAQNGRGGQAIEVFDEMVKGGTKPDCISFIGVLFACSHTGLVDEGKRYFRSMTEDYGIAAGIEHYNCMVDLLSRVGLLKEAEDLINNAKYRDDSSLWAALLGACATYSSPGVAERVAKKMMELEPQYHLSYVLLANVYKTVGRWNDALQVRKLMRERGVRKAPGKSWIEVNRRTCVLLNKDGVDKPNFEDSEDQFPGIVNSLEPANSEEMEHNLIPVLQQSL